MAMHEMAGYPLVAPSMSYTDRVIQHSSTYWGATFLGQINIALAFGASIIFCANSTDLSEIIDKEQITVLGLVPSQLNAISAPCPSIRVVLTWGEKMSKQIAEKWKSKCGLIELLVST
jgi:acyl-coenzyme A synthetase/AMP-(fatty) acid ligase